MSVERAPLIAALFLAGCTSEEEFTNYCAADIVVNEVMAAGGTDWIELYNHSGLGQDLAGYGLASTSWEVQFVFPEADARTLVPDGAFLRVWADTYRVDEEGEAADALTIGFDLNRDGDAVYLRAPEAHSWALCDALDYPDQHQDVAWARVPDGVGQGCHAAENTPGGSNVGCR